MTQRVEPAIRFERYIAFEPNTGCWLWTGGQVPDGYGCFYWGADGIRNEKAHRASWRINRGPLSPDDQVLHRCDVRCCVNPDHLFLGDNSANVADRVAKGRSARLRGDLNGMFTDGRSILRGTIGTPKGERVGNSKLTEADVVAIRVAPGFHKTIADKFGVSPSLISQIKLRKVWAHVG